MDSNNNKFLYIAKTFKNNPNLSDLNMFSAQVVSLLKKYIGRVIL
jgi:hypothetical protein